MGLKLSSLYSSGSHFERRKSSPQNGGIIRVIEETSLHPYDDSHPILLTDIPFAKNHSADHERDMDSRAQRELHYHMEGRLLNHVYSRPFEISSPAIDEDTTSVESSLRQERKIQTAKSSSWSTHAEDKFYGIMLFCFSIVDFILLACIISIWAMNPRQTDIAHEESIAAMEIMSPEDSSFCLPCEEIYINSLEVQHNRFKVQVTRDEKNNGNLCCDEEHSDLKRFAQSMYLRVHYQRDRARGVITLSNNTSDAKIDLQVHSLHLAWTLDTAGHLTETGGKFSVPLRKRDTTSAPASRFLELENNVVKVKETGLYYLYSHVPFKLGAAAHDARNLTQFVYRLRQGADELLLENSVSPCQLVEETKMQSFVGGLFQLKADDAVCLRVSDATAVDVKRKFQFGVHHV